MRTTYVVLILNLQAFLVLHVTGITIWENELIKKIFQQDPAFCFQPFKASDCAGSHWISSPNNSRNAHESFLKPKTLFFLFTPKNPSNPEFLHLCGGKLPSNSNFDPLHQTEVFIHGYLDGVCRSAWMRVSEKVFVISLPEVSLNHAKKNHEFTSSDNRVRLILMSAITFITKPNKAYKLLANKPCKLETMLNLSM
nr:uncharacterized protein LOC122271882 [Parasteatoda tepidariorum]